MWYQEVYDYWKTNSFFDQKTRSELSSLDVEKDAKEIEDRFYRDLEFGTGGLRGIMSAGTNRMNKYTVGKATKGLGNYLLDTYGADVCKERGVVIVYDTRNNSELFAKTAANDIEKFKKGCDAIIANRYDTVLDDVQDKVYTRDLFRRD